MDARRVIGRVFLIRSRSASHSPDSLDEVRASRQQLGRPGQRSSATPTRSAYENERILRFQTLCRTLTDVAEWPTSTSSREARMPACVGQAEARCTPRERPSHPYTRKLRELKFLRVS